VIEPLLQAERLLVHGLVDQAEELYRRTLQSDPRNSIAVVGLARVALERGDDRLAYGHACAALEIDPQNVAALRLEARLSEVLVARGELVDRPAWLAGPAGPAAAPRPPATAADVGPPPAPEPAPAAEPRPSESVMLTRNPSMADHRRMEDATSQAAPPEQDAPTPARPRSLLRRLLGR
jgi:hypothetical protein